MLGELYGAKSKAQHEQLDPHHRATHDKTYRLGYGRKCSWPCAINSIRKIAHVMRKGTEMTSQVLSAQKCGDMCANFVARFCSIEQYTRVAKAISYGLSPIFGAKKKRSLLVSELAILYTAIIILAANRAYDAKTAKSVIDAFLDRAREKLFLDLEKQVPNFKQTYSARMENYFRIFHQDRATLGISFAFMQQLGLDPLGDMKGQMWLIELITVTVSETENVMTNLIISEPSSQPELPMEQHDKDRRLAAMGEFVAAINRWPLDERMTAMAVVTAALEGDDKQSTRLLGKLSSEKIVLLNRFIEQQQR